MLKNKSLKIQGLENISIISAACKNLVPGAD